ncbi:MAG: Fic family protein [Acidimicrobiaceae bacterium]|nr:Fic family protein [Acidimicrobiia bacterium]MCY4492480.1 Fic family protein [Acidimicrobiaceae bacterium]
MAKVLAPPDWDELFNEVVKRGPARLGRIFSTANPVDPKGRYLHWDEMWRREPPDGLTLKEWWFGTVNSRNALARNLPLKGVNGDPFRFSNVDPVQAMVHRIDQQASGRIDTEDALTAIQSRDRYLVSSLLAEEAITSSMLEGAATTRRVAREMLQTERQPRNHSERMILNNYRAVSAAGQLADQETPLTPDDVLELHRIVTSGTLVDEADAGRLQEPGEDRVIVAGDDNKVLHIPPAAEELPERLEQLCAFANGESDEGFLHPVVRAILIHFWVGHDHPFVDGNGRTARALFYWLMLRSGYWLASYFSISTILREAPAQYIRSYLHSETDGNDATYFVIHQLRVIDKAITSLNKYVAKKISEVAEVERVARTVPSLNRRQVAVVKEAHRDPYRIFTIREHQYQEQVTYQTARTDLLGLEQLGLLTRIRMSRTYEFRSSGDIPAALRALAGQAVSVN